MQLSLYIIHETTKPRRTTNGALETYGIEDGGYGIVRQATQAAPCILDIRGRW